MLCVPYKILERLIYARVEPLIDLLLPKEQAGFRRGKSTVDQVVLLTQNTEDSFEAKKKAGAVFIDLTAAYDTVWHRGLTCKLIDELTIMNEKNFESIFIKIQLHNENLFCGNIYRSPSNDSHLNENFLNNLYNCIHNNNESLNKYFISGDFNYDLSNQDNEHICNFIEMMLEGLYFPVINKPTRITDTSATVLDHIWTNLHHQDIKSEVIFNPLFDRLPVYMCFNLNKQNLYRPQQKDLLPPKYNQVY